MNEEMEDASIQEHLETGKHLQRSEDVLAYERLFTALKSEPAIHPSAAFSMQVANRVNPKQEVLAAKRFYWLQFGCILCVLLPGLPWLLFFDQPDAFLVLYKSLWLAKEWLLVGLTCVTAFLFVEHRFLHKQLINKIRLG